MAQNKTALIESKNMMLLRQLVRSQLSVVSCSVILHNALHYMLLQFSFLFSYSFSCTFQIAFIRNVFLRKILVHIDYVALCIKNIHKNINI